MPAPLGDKCRPVWASLRMFKPQRHHNCESRILMLTSIPPERDHEYYGCWKMVRPQFLVDEFLYRFFRRYKNIYSQQKIDEIFGATLSRLGSSRTHMYIRSSTKGFGSAVAIVDDYGEHRVFRQIPIPESPGERYFYEKMGVSMATHDHQMYARELVSKKHKTIEQPFADLYYMIYAVEAVWKNKLGKRKGACLMRYREAIE